MSLRLPSQNKFRPTARPGMKKGPAPPARPPAQPQANKASSQTSITPSTSQQTIAIAPSSSQTITGPSSSQAGPSSSQAGPSSSQTAVPASPAPASSVITSPSSTLVPSQIPPSLGTTLKPPVKSPTKTTTIAPQAIPSQQIQQIRSAQPESHPPSSTTTAANPIPPQPELPPTLTPSPATTSAPLAPPVALAPPAPKLSLLDAARSHTSNGPSPGSIRRGTPSLSSRSIRAPSSTPQPAPRLNRAPSTTPQPQRASSVTPQPPRPASGTVQRPREPSTTPQMANAHSNGLPPSLGIKSSPAPTQTNFGFPPSLGTTSAPVAPPPPPPAPPIDAAALAAAVVASIVPHRPVVPAPGRKGKRRIARKHVPTISTGNTPDEGSRGGTQAKRISRQKQQPVRAATEERGTTDEAEDDDEGSEYDTDTDGGKRRKSTNGTRPSKRAKVSKPKRPAVASISLHDIQPEEMVGDTVDEVLVTMGDLATTLAAQGRVTQRAIKIDEFKSIEHQKKREERRVRQEQAWRRNQIKRRKVRATKNRDRARRREELGQLGMDEASISPDEEDSEEEYEPEPERLTPESTPEPDIGMDSQGPERAAEEDDYEERSAVDIEDWNADQAAETGEGEESLFLPGGMDGDSQFGEAPELGLDGAAQAEEDDDMAALRAAGFLINEDQGRGAGDDDEDDDLDDEPWLRGEEPDIEGYRQALEQRRRRVIEDQDRDDQDIVEIDDETRFINSASFTKHARPQRWTVVDTELFYQVLEETGENYTLMKAYFPGRTIKQLKMKGLRENKSQPAKMTAAILARKPIDKEYLTKSAGYDHERPWDKEDALFQEAKDEVDRLRRLDSTRPEGMDEYGDGDVALEQAAVDDEGEAEGDGEVEGEVEGDEEGQFGEGDEGAVDEEYAEEG